MKGRERNAPRFKYVTTDATFDVLTEHAAIAACLPNRPIDAKVIRCRGSQDGEMAAIEMACLHLRTAQARFIEIRTDSKGAADMIQHAQEVERGNAVLRRYGDPQIKLLATRIAYWLNHPPRGGSWRIQHVIRRDVTPAHTLAHVVAKAWREGHDLALEEGNQATPLGAEA